MRLRNSGIVIGLVGIILLASCPLVAQEAEEQKPEHGWQKELVGNLNLTQTQFDNWTQGGEDAFAWQLNINSKALRDEEQYKWDNSGKVSYGQTKLADFESRKSVDEVRLESVFTYLLGVYVNPYVAASAETQFTKGYDYGEDPKIAVSTFLDPGYFSQSAGVGYEPVKEFKTRLGFALHETVTSDFPKPYADDPDTAEVEKTKVEPGLESVTDFSKSLIGNILMTSKLELFYDFGAIDETDVRWDNIFSAKISKYIDVNFNVKLLYDRDSSVKRQLKQALAVGLTYTFL
ncbi:DUF3078 domain-containing protein [Candidatus Poribacteria bacterium]